MIEYIVYLQRNGVYVEGVKCKNQEEANIVIDTAEEYESAYVFSYSKGLNLTPSEKVVVLKDSGDVYSRNQVKDETLGELITTINL